MQRPMTRVGLAAEVVVMVLCALLPGCGSDDDAATHTTADTATTTNASSTTAPPASDAQVVVIAHRGASDSAPEHTFAAYDLALEQGADYIEQDLQLTADGVLIVFHDSILDRVARGPADSCTGEVATKTLAQIQACDVGSWVNEANPDAADPAYVGLRIPTLEEVLERYGPEVNYYIEIKTLAAGSGMEQPLIDLLDGAGLIDPSGESRQVLVQSFSAETLQLMHDLEPALPLVQLLVESPDPIQAATLDSIPEYAVAIGPASANVDPALVDAAHTRCLDVHPYTVNDPNEMAEFLDAGVDGMFTNVPDVLVELRDQHDPPPESCTPASSAP